MKKIPKQEYTAEFKEQAVKRAQAVGHRARPRKRAGAGGADAAQLGEGSRRPASSIGTRDEAGDAGADGAVDGCAPRTRG